MATARNGWFAAWPLLEALLPGATLFLLLLWLSRRFVREGFRDVRQYAFAPAGRWSLATRMQRKWPSCTCSVGACGCFAAIVRGLRQCCFGLLADKAKNWGG